MNLSLTEIFNAQVLKTRDLQSRNAVSRIAKLNMLLNWILNNRSSIQKALNDDLRKSPEESDITEIYVIITELRYAIKHLKEWTRPLKVNTPITMLGTQSYIYHEPKGVCLIIAPWNFPFNLIVGPLISAIAAGNSVMLKPSEHTPSTAVLIEKMINELFHHSEVVVINGGIEITQELLLLPFNHIFFTGSSLTGKKIMKAAAENLSGITLELGGKSPVIIDRDCNLKDAAKKIVWGKFTNAGQTCIAPDYILVPVEIKDELLQHIILEIKRVYETDENEIKLSTNFSRIVNEHHFERLNKLLDDALANGAKLEYGGERDRLTKFFGPCLLSNLPDCEMMDEEIFGPILPMIEYKNKEEIINLLSKKLKPLSLYIFSKNKSFINTFILETSSGAVCINDILIHYSHPELPFGGVNNSGIGKAHGFFGFEEFSNKKAVIKQRIGYTLPQLLYPPFSNFKRTIINFLIKYF